MDEWCGLKTMVRADASLDILHRWCESISAVSFLLWLYNTAYLHGYRVVRVRVVGALQRPADGLTRREMLVESHCEDFPCHWKGQDGR